MSYYRKFKDTTFYWSETCENAVKVLKQKITEAPVLIQPDIDSARDGSKPFVIYTDASIAGIGAVLSQLGDDNQLHPVYYASKSTSRQEKNYSITDLEALAVAFAVRKFRMLIFGTDIIVRTDHQPLLCTMKRDNISGRMMRWALEYQEYRIKFEYIKEEGEHLPLGGQVVMQVVEKEAKVDSDKIVCAIRNVKFHGHHEETNAFVVKDTLLDLYSACSFCEDNIVSLCDVMGDAKFTWKASTPARLLEGIAVALASNITNEMKAEWFSQANSKIPNGVRIDFEWSEMVLWKFVMKCEHRRQLMLKSLHLPMAYNVEGSELNTYTDNGERIYERLQANGMGLHAPKSLVKCRMVVIGGPNAKKLADYYKAEYVLAPRVADLQRQANSLFISRGTQLVVIWLDDSEILHGDILASEYVSILADSIKTLSIREHVDLLVLPPLYRDRETSPKTMAVMELLQNMAEENLNKKITFVASQRVSETTFNSSLGKSSLFPTYEHVDRDGKILGQAAINIIYTFLAAAFPRIGQLLPKPPATSAPTRKFNEPPLQNNSARRPHQFQGMPSLKRSRRF
uniref:Reverse transcriptase RNase H-like domain-containing protein n=1 Tax=Acrobeloides nanus TaxID=290746 RepID=A0A914ER58_9BILA